MSSRDKILQVALEQFYRKGYLATSVDDIIAEARVSKSNFYYHFKSKEELALVVLEQRREEYARVLDRLLGRSEQSAAERLLDLVQFLVDSQDKRLEKGGCPFGNLVAEMAEHNERFRCYLSDLFCGMSQRVALVVEDGQRAGEFRRDLEASDVAWLFVQATQGMLLMTKCHKSVETLGRGGRLLTRLISTAD